MSNTAVKDAKKNGITGKDGVIVKSITEKISEKMEEKAKETFQHVIQLSIDEKIQKVSDLNDLIAKRNRFLESKSKLNSFNLKREDSTTKISISDLDGNSFITSQSDAIDKILSTLKNTIDEALAEVEAKIQF
jgi:hypothetical protein